MNACAPTWVASIRFFRVQCSWVRIMCVAAALLLASPVLASQRVLIRFDETGHHLHRVVSIAVEKSAPQSDSKVPVSKDVVSPQRYAMQIRWYDPTGNLLATDYQADPRVSHAPSQKSSVKPTFVRLLNGAYVVTGPPQSTLLQIKLPDRLDVGLAAEIWQIHLGD